jgi:hypothetical protein
MASAQVFINGRGLVPYEPYISYTGLYFRVALQYLMTITSSRKIYSLISLSSALNQFYRDL